MNTGACVVRRGQDIGCDPAARANNYISASIRRAPFKPVNVPIVEKWTREGEAPCYDHICGDGRSPFAIGGNFSLHVNNAIIWTSRDNANGHSTHPTGWPTHGWPKEYSGGLALF